MRETHLAALETEDFDALGSDVYTRGFITAYARFLGLDPGPLLEAHRQERDGGPVQRPERRRAQPVRHEQAPPVRIRTGRVAVLLVLALVVVVGVVVFGLWGPASGQVLPAWQ